MNTKKSKKKATKTTAKKATNGNGDARQDRKPSFITLSLVSARAILSHAKGGTPEAKELTQAVSKAFARPQTWSDYKEVGQLKRQVDKAQKAAEKVAAKA